MSAYRIHAQYRYHDEIHVHHLDISSRPRSAWVHTPLCAAYPRTTRQPASIQRRRSAHWTSSRASSIFVACCAVAYCLYHRLLSPLVAEVLAGKRTLVASHRHLPQTGDDENTEFIMDVGHVTPVVRFISVVHAMLG